MAGFWTLVTRKSFVMCLYGGLVRIVTKAVNVLEVIVPGLEVHAPHKASACRGRDVVLPVIVKEIPIETLFSCLRCLVNL